MKPTQFLFAFSILLGSLLISCSDDNCNDTTCMNGGLCLDGVCDCPERFTGTNCQDQLTPDKIRINSIVLTRFPGSNGPASWDEGDGPDIFFRLYDEEHAIAQPLVLFENATTDQPYTFFINLIDMHHIMSEHTIQLLDYEEIGVPGQLMGEIKFTPYHSTNAFPETIVLDNGGPVAFTMTVEYFYSTNNR